MGKGMKKIFLIFILSSVVALMWNQIPAIKQAVHIILDPSVGKLLDWNTTYGMIIVIIIFSLITSLLQKYMTDQETLKEIKKEQKILQEEAKKYKDHPEKLMEFQKKQLEFIPKTMEITMRPVMYTIIPFVLFFRWFNDYFAGGFKFFGFLSWIWFYILCSIILSMVWKKILKLA